MVEPDWEIVVVCAGSTSMPKRLVTWRWRMHTATCPALLVHLLNLLKNANTERFDSAGPSARFLARLFSWKTAARSTAVTSASRISDQSTQNSVRLRPRKQTWGIRTLRAANRTACSIRSNNNASGASGRRREPEKRSRKDSYCRFDFCELLRGWNCSH